MNKYKKDAIKVSVCGIVIFAIGLFIGYQLNNGTISSIQGYLFNSAGEATSSNASDGNASDANASSANASSANASDGNASSANASSANATSTDNILFLQSFALQKTNAKQGDVINVTLVTSGACNSAASVVFNGDNGASFTAQVQDISGNPYLVVPSSAVATRYVVTEVLLVGRNSNNTTFTKQYGLVGDNSFDFNTDLTIEEKEVSNQVEIQKATLTSLTLENTSGKAGDKVYFEYETSQAINKLQMTFTSEEGKKFTVYAKEVPTTPYVEIPSDAEGTYSLTDVVIYTSNSSTAYSKDGKNNTQKFAFNSTIIINKEDDHTYIYDNKDITPTILNKLYNAPSGSSIAVYADTYPLINKELFDAIKGSNKQLYINYEDNQIVFDGSDITSSKTIDISMTIDEISNDEEISELVLEGIVIDFPDNGNLPGKALVRIKDIDIVNEILNESVYVYVYNQETNDFCVVDKNVKLTEDGYFEFTITHHSKYIMVNEELDSNLVVSQVNSDIVEFQKGNTTLLMLIAIGVAVIVAVVILIIVLKKKNTSQKNTSI